MRILSLLLVFLSGTLVARAQSTYIGSPLALGDTYSRGPFLVDQTQASSVRYQEVFAASDFARIGSPLWITELRFDPTELININVNLANIRIDLSTTGRVPDGLSPVFAENVGADNTVAFSGPLHFFDTAVEGFGVHIPLQTPFLYDPSRGSLLMDVRNFMTISPIHPFAYSQLVSESTLNDTVSSALAFDVNSPTALLSTIGLLTVFRVTPVPEPSTVALLILGLAAFGLVAWKRSGVRRVEHRGMSAESLQGRASHVID